MLTDNELDVVMCTELAAIQELLQTDATTASIREALRLIARTVEREAYRRAAAECRAMAVDFRRTGNHCSYDWKADSAEDCAEAIEALGREE